MVVLLLRAGVEEAAAAVDAGAVGGGAFVVRIFGGVCAVVGDGFVVFDDVSEAAGAAVAVHAGAEGFSVAEFKEACGCFGY